MLRESHIDKMKLQWHARARKREGKTENSGSPRRSRFSYR